MICRKEVHPIGLANLQVLVNNVEFPNVKEEIRCLID